MFDDVPLHIESGVVWVYAHFGGALGHMGTVEITYNALTEEWVGTYEPGCDGMANNTVSFGCTGGPDPGTWALGVEACTDDPEIPGCSPAAADTSPATECSPMDVSFSGTILVGTCAGARTCTVNTTP